MKKVLCLVILLGLLAPVILLRCESCVYIFLEEYGRVYNCNNEAVNGRPCPRNNNCYSMKMTYNKHAADEKLAWQDPPLGRYTWIMQGCIYSKRNATEYICNKKVSQYQNSFRDTTEDYHCEVETCSGSDRCNRDITGNFLDGVDTEN